jgi:RNase P subunit RPR2
MQVKLRYCNECKRNTIQAGDNYADTSWSPTKIIPVWYCPNCGTQWKIEKKSVDIAMSKRPL